MYILGLSTMGNSAACLFKNNKLLYAIEEERLSRIKNDSSFPKLAIQKILEKEKIKISDIKIIYIYWNPWNFLSRFLEVLKKFFFPSQFKNILSKALNVFLFSKSSSASIYNSWIDLFFIKKIINKNIGQWSGKIRYVDHHLSHILYASAIKNFKNSIILSYDGGGEKHSTILAVNENYKLKIIKKIKWPNSLGHFYSFFTGFLGFEMLEGEYKMMGLAPYGKPKYEKIIFNKILKLSNNGEYKFNHNLCSYHNALLNKFDKKIIAIFGSQRTKNQPITQKHMDIAASVQLVFEKVQLHMLKWAVNCYPKIDNLVISGGCGLNVSANGVVLKENIFKNISVPPAPHDAGCSIGSVLFHFFSANSNLDFSFLKNVANPYLGFDYKDKEIRDIIKKNKFSLPTKFKSKKKLNQYLVKKLINKKVIAWFQGKDEFGPRALGSRSFLADPRSNNIKHLINLKIKQREKFRPFAPSILDEYFKNYFDISQESPYMNIVSEVNKSKSLLFPAVVHFGTSRIHTVSKKNNKNYHMLLSEFFKKTKVPILLNTSFNIQEPIVSTPFDAIKTFIISKVDYLVIGNYLFDSNWRSNNKSKIFNKVV